MEMDRHAAEMSNYLDFLSKCQKSDQKQEADAARDRVVRSPTSDCAVRRVVARRDRCHQGVLKYPIFFRTPWMSRHKLNALMFAFDTSAFNVSLSCFLSSVITKSWCFSITVLSNNRPCWLCACSDMVGQRCSLGWSLLIENTCFLWSPSSA